MIFMTNNGESVWEDYATVCDTHAVNLSDLGFEAEHSMIEYCEPACSMCNGWEPTLMTMEQGIWKQVLIDAA